jgi:release factor glutamine methyltransferase
VSDAGAVPPRDFDPAEVAKRLAAGRQMFLGVELLCGPGALVPRPETEILGALAVEKVRAASPGARVVDMCCGAGNLGCAIAVHVPDSRVWSSDLTADCVSWTRRNVEHLGLAERVTPHQGDLFAPLDPLGLEGQIDVVVCNPPYISTGRLAADRASLLELEPREAFDGGPYGLTIHQRVVEGSLRYLKPRGWLLMEFGLGQHRQVKILLERTRHYDAIDFQSDAAGNPRVVAARVSGSPAQR